VLRVIFATMGEEVAGGWRSLQEQEFHKLYASPTIIIMISQRGCRGRSM
jgi:hypothetical protein